jgi:serine/threonine protein kinase
MIVNQPVEIPAGISDELRDLLRRLLLKNPNERIRLAKIKEHPWVAIGGQPDPFEQLRTMGYLDREVLLTMQELGIDCTELSADLEAGRRNKETTVYRILRRKAIANELAALQPPISAEPSVMPAAIPQMLSSSELPTRKFIRTCSGQRTASVEGKRRVLCVQSRMCVVKAAATVKTARRLRYKVPVAYATAMPGQLTALA